MCQPVYHKYRKPELFKKVKINKEFGYLTWGQGNEEMDFLPEHIKEFEMKRDAALSESSLAKEWLSEEDKVWDEWYAKKKKVVRKIN